MAMKCRGVVQNWLKNTLGYIYRRIRVWRIENAMTQLKEYFTFNIDV